ncbi:ribosomal protein subunit L9 [Schizosaccharomyces japonicus yFS275]|uniref:Large ribosomal subunit protein uL3m n=1 Tax=Schizosaccharomyces japonicus (strain yFS275 / FY16936) TaxID=402676 RepID=B6JXV0_SCHJY|nr:ribosomal protein subunit L9 [Schizosaccharomyces japonicus yFS275]EEB06368.1 ribosomal protein subunit L9 [Schizosaccharomyces japonicus yFS275]
MLPFLRPSFSPFSLSHGLFRTLTTCAASKLPLDTPEAVHKRRLLRTRPGAILFKKGMTSVWDESTHQQVPVTVLQFDRVQVVGLKTEKRDGYSAVQMGAGLRLPHNVSRALQGHFSANGVYPKRYVKEFQVKDDSCLPKVGTVLTPEYFQVGQHVDVKALTKGKGTAGVMKRWGLSGGNDSHGASKSHRSAGGTGQAKIPARVLPGKKMSGHMGHQFRTVQNMLVWAVHPEHDCILVKGAVPGPVEGVVYVSDSIIQLYKRPSA